MHSENDKSESSCGNGLSSRLTAFFSRMHLPMPISPSCYCGFPPGQIWCGTVETFRMIRKVVVDLDHLLQARADYSIHSTVSVANTAQWCADAEIQWLDSRMMTGRSKSSKYAEVRRISSLQSLQFWIHFTVRECIMQLFVSTWEMNEQYDKWLPPTEISCAAYWYFFLSFYAPSCVEMTITEEPCTQILLWSRNISTTLPHCFTFKY